MYIYIYIYIYMYINIFIRIYICMYISGDLTGGSPSTFVTVYTKHVHVMFNQHTVSLLQTLGA